MTSRTRWFTSVAVVTALSVGTSLHLSAHCDGLDGPVVKAAERALATGDVSHVLVWVQTGDERKVREAFDQTIAVRQLGERARALADRYLFETVVRLHRAGEGAPYTGLKPAGRDLGPAIPAADAALESGSLERLRPLLTSAVVEGLEHQFHQVVEARQRAASGDVQAGRAAVSAYVEFVHFVERVYEAATHPAPGHGSR